MDRNTPHDSSGGRAEDKIERARRTGTILLVEDNSDDVELTMRAFKRTGITNAVVTLPDGAQALDYLRRQGTFNNRQGPQPALVLLDLKLPRVDGLEVLAQVKGDPQLNTLPVVMLTSSNHETDVVRAYQLGVNSYVCKPTDFAQFLNVIRTLGSYWFEVVEMPPDSREKASGRH